MDEKDLERLGLNRNEAKVYLALVMKGEATAAELVKAIGVHRNIVYDNIEKLIEKGLVSFVVDGVKKKFIAQNPDTIIEYLQSKKEKIDQEMTEANKIIPQIGKLLSTSATKQEATIFRGTKGVKNALSDTLEYKDIFVIGITNESVDVLGITFWQNYNQKIKDRKIKEYTLVNNNYVDEGTGLLKKKNIYIRKLPKDLNQIIETLIYSGKVAIFVYSSQPIVIVMENKEIFKMYKAHFDFLWKISKDKKMNKKNN